MQLGIALDFIAGTALVAVGCALVDWRLLGAGRVGQAAQRAAYWVLGACLAVSGVFVLVRWLH